jgi:ribonuclease-3
MKTLEEKLGYQFRDRRLLENALTHSSFANEHHMGAVGSNERLEFLGDSVLGMVVADDLFHRYSRLPEGDLTRLRAQLVCEASLARVARELELGSYLCLGKGDESTGGRERPSIIADAVEAVLAAVYLDSGSIREPRRIIRKFILEHMEEAREASRDHKTHLQELVQRRSGQVLSYHLIGQSGPDHNKSFEMEVRLNGETVGTGTGRSKKEAEQMAARAAIAKLEEE